MRVSSTVTTSSKRTSKKLTWRTSKRRRQRRHGCIFLQMLLAGVIAKIFKLFQAFYPKNYLQISFLGFWIFRENIHPWVKEVAGVSSVVSPTIIIVQPGIEELKKSKKRKNKKKRARFLEIEDDNFSSEVGFKVINVWGRVARS